MLNLEKDSVPDHAFAYDSGVGVSLRLLEFNFSSYREISDSALSILSNLGQDAIKKNIKIYSTVSNYLRTFPTSGQILIKNKNQFSVDKIAEFQIAQ